MKYTGAGSLRYPYWKESNIYVYLTPYTKINSKWIINLNIKGKKKFSEKNLGEYIGLGRFHTLKLRIYVN